MDKEPEVNEKSLEETDTQSVIAVSEVVEDSTRLEKRRFLPSEAEKIHQSVMFGSVFLALEREFFTYDALLKWLCTAEYGIETRIAYKAVCGGITPDDQYLEDKFHFLTKRPEYASIALACGLNEEISDHKPFDPTEYNPLLAHICETLGELCRTPALKSFTALIVAGQGTATYLRCNLGICYRSRNFPYLRISAEEINTRLVEADWAEKFRYNSTLAHLVLRRVARLQREAPIYYASVAYKIYRNVILKLNKEKLLTMLSRDEMATIDSFFPEIIDRRLLEYSDLAYKIAVLTNDVAGYILGFPIQDMIPNDDQIHSAIQYLTNHGTEAYSDLISKYVSSNYLPDLPFHTSKPSYSNDHDFMLEDLDSYVPFDIVSFQSGTHVYRFTRPEFPALIKSKKNHWTNEWLPPTVLSTIKARYEAAKELGLPPPRPLTEMLSRTESGSLFDPDDDSTPDASTPHDPLTPLRAQPPIHLPLIVSSSWIPGLPQDDEESSRSPLEDSFPFHAFLTRSADMYPRTIRPENVVQHRFGARRQAEPVEHRELATPFLVSENPSPADFPVPDVIFASSEESEDSIPELIDDSSEGSNRMEEVD